MKRSPSFISATAILAAVLLLLGVALWSLLGGQSLFSPGALNAEATGPGLGGAQSHADLSDDCGACHPPPWSGSSMAEGCLDCHTGVAAELEAREGLHGGLADGRGETLSCRSCHPEHDGPDGALTVIDEAAFRSFDHTATGFPLEGRHADTPCRDCHKGVTSATDLARAPRQCSACHADDDVHDGGYGRACGSCHNAASWDDVTFDHGVFPLDHGSEEREAACETCHPDGTSTYGCFGCHEHSVGNVLDEHEERPLSELRDCVDCHPGGREAEDD